MAAAGEMEEAKAVVGNVEVPVLVAEVAEKSMDAEAEVVMVGVAGSGVNSAAGVW